MPGAGVDERPETSGDLVRGADGGDAIEQRADVLFEVPAEERRGISAGILSPVLHVHEDEGHP
jgi:hypothetical protein